MRHKIWIPPRAELIRRSSSRLLRCIFFENVPTWILHILQRAHASSLITRGRRQFSCLAPVEINRSASFTDGDEGVAAGGEVRGKRRTASSCKHWPLPERLAWPLLSWQLYQKLDGIFIMKEMEIFNNFQVDDVVVAFVARSCHPETDLSPIISDFASFHLCFENAFMCALCRMDACRG